ncbi:MAG: hypothetical protein ABUS57_07085 [Pseudomonadota bacterium]
MTPEQATARSDRIDPPGTTTLPLALSLLAVAAQGFFTLTFCWGIIRELAG